MKLIQRCSRSAAAASQLRAVKQRTGIKSVWQKGKSRFSELAEMRIRAGARAIRFDGLGAKLCQQAWTETKEGDGVVRFPVRELIWMSLFLLLVAVVATLLAAPLQRAYLANPFFNTLILSVLVIGILVHVRQILRLWPEIRWLDEYRRGDSRELEPPRRGLMASMAQMLIARQRQRLVLSPSTMRVLLDGIRARLDESRDVARYLIGLLIFLGLLGTFWGLLDTLTSVSAVLGSLEVDSDDAGAMFG